MNRVLALGLCVLAAAFAAATGVMAPSDPYALASACVGVVFVVMGAFIEVRVSGNAVGLMMALYGLLLGLTTLLDAYIWAGMPESAWVAWASNWIWYPQVVTLIVLIPLFFPDGRLPGRAWRWVIFSAAIGWVGFGFGNAFAEVLLDSYGLVNPAAVELPELLEGSLQITGFLGLLGAIGGAVAAAVIRFRTSSGQLRQQMKWFVSAAVLLAVSFALNGFFYETGRPEVGRLLVVVASVGLAGGIGIAVLKYRLYDIDKIVSRTLAYALLVIVLGAVFALGVVAIPNLMIEESAPPLIVAGTTLVIAALFNPLRKRLQRRVDRRFNRARYDAERVIDEFAGALRDQTDEGEVLDGWVGVVSETMHPSSVAVWVRQ